MRSDGEPVVIRWLAVGRLAVRMALLPRAVVCAGRVVGGALWMIVRVDIALMAYDARW